MMKLHGLSAKRLSAFTVILLLGGTRVATATNVQWTGANLADFNNTNNWTGGLKPDGGVDEAAAINNSTTALLTVPYTTDFTGSNSVNGVKLGLGAGEIGGLRIGNGGSLASTTGTTETGAIQVGVAGQGNLTVLGGGSLTGVTLSLGGTVGSSMTLGDTSGLTATVLLTGAGASSLNRTTNIIGPNVNFTASGNLTLGSTSVLNGEIRHALNHSALKSNGTATLNGTFKPTFVGVVPGAGSSWTIVDAANITGSFSALDLSSAPALAAGLAYQVEIVNGGFGKQAKLSVSEVLTLNVNRTTGAVSIQNIGSTAKTFDGYSILSSRGALNPATWNSLDDQNVGGADAWLEAAPTANDLSELNPNGSSTLAGGGGSFSLGTPYVQIFPEFGTDPDHLQFEYTLIDGSIVEGSVVYSGTKIVNDLLLTVNKTTGAVQLKNDSPYDIFIDGYAVYSPSGLLRPANGQWSSLQDQAVTGWEEADPTTTVVSELRQSGSMRLTAGSGFNLGTLYSPGAATEDLRFEFLQEDDAGPTEGLVIYGTAGAVGATSAGVLGDFNNDGTVNTADYVLWRNAQGTNTILRNDPIGGTIGTAQYNLWRANFGNSTAGGAGASLPGVPEPASVLLLTMAVAATAVSRRGRAGKMFASK